MIAVDTSALIALIMGEMLGPACERILESESEIFISAATFAEALIVSERRNVTDAMRTLIETGGFNIIPVSAATAERVGQIHARWGRGRHAANLNFGDCFAYDAAKINDCPLLFVGNDFSKTDIPSAL